MERALARHIRDNLGLYLVIFFFFLGGIIAGTVTLYFLEEQQVLQLAAYLDNLLQQFNSSDISGYKVVQQAIINALKEIGLVWFLGLTVIGIPLIIVVVFLKGFILGFTVGFLVQQKAIHGVALSLMAIMPPNLIQIPALFVAAMLGISFSTSLMHGRSFNERGILPRFLNYSIFMLLVTLLVAGGGLVEAYLAPVFVRVVLNYF
ncbi:MAG: stage sporulation protein [Moorella sp. (in: firmicutes)]|uniref:stage II sporulation protein M n=1 Tax=unclassified Neomoorella TaxID=2676739 RepID=UPI0010FFAD64|nr:MULTISPECIES: stage II sporulation protein M [unclassified Moorella (in: firmicutes)]MDK2817182.1 stage sporulation protein [Moorella sp. (in: firmicutes)]MDK2895544.1 stage sporulation protein [Moorella sp. (in: firmicutes)]GEA15937.1 stage II sporulation protein M [Moorella sp. E308F]GEA19245.1 stage II sporulation protein M [Moorella sp. E306M]